MSSSTPKLVTTVAQLRDELGAVRRAGKKIGLVPTMGALHEGHLSLVRAARAECDYTVVSIYVNPSQFGPGEDFAKYPRTLEDDLALLAGCRTDLVFAPSNEEVYRPGHATWVEVGAVAEPLEGACRPGHFRGVATIVLKLLNMVQPDVAYFGQKDFQQALVIRRMVADLDVPVAIRVCPIVREADGLAMSSRNRYLSPAARQRALVLWKSLQLAGELVATRRAQCAGDRRADARAHRDGRRRPDRLHRPGRSRHASAGRDHHRPHAGRTGRENRKHATDRQLFTRTEMKWRVASGHGYFRLTTHYPPPSLTTRHSTLCVKHCSSFPRACRLSGVWRRPVVGRVGRGERRRVGVAGMAARLERRHLGLRAHPAADRRHHPLGVAGGVRAARACPSAATA